MGSKIASKFSDKMSVFGIILDRLSVRVDDDIRTPGRSIRDYSVQRDKYKIARNRSNSRGMCDDLVLLL